MTNHAGNEPTAEQILAALNAYSSKGLEIDGYDPTDEYPSLDMWGERFASQMRAALVAAQGAARPVNGFDTSAERVQNGGDSLHVAPVLPSSGVDEDKLAEVIGYAYNSEHHDPATHAARAVAEWLKGQGNAARE